MPKVTVEFSLPEEERDHKMAMNAPKIMSVISDFTQFLRSKTKYSQETGSWEEVHKEWWKILNETGIDPYDD